jgi:hypothetical protein
LHEPTADWNACSVRTAQTNLQKFCSQKIDSNTHIKAAQPSAVGGGFMSRLFDISQHSYFMANSLYWQRGIHFKRNDHENHYLEIKDQKAGFNDPAHAHNHCQ